MRRPDAIEHYRRATWSAAVSITPLTDIGVRHSKRHHLLLAATNAVIDCYQLTFLNIKLFRLVHFPFMVAVAAQGIALVLFL